MKVLDPNLEAILTDIHSGSRQLLIKLNKLFENYSKEDINKSLIRKIRKAFPTFSAIQHYLDELEGILNNDEEDILLSFFDSVSAGYEQINEKLFSNLKPYLHRNIKIFTLSNSSTVFEILKKIHHEFAIKEIIVSESRPQMEGVILSEFLANQNIPVTLIIEADIPNYIEKADICLIGADIILSNGNIVNKTGSKLLALICKLNNKPFYVIADSSKQSKGNTFNQKLESPSQILPTPNKNIKVLNNYFEEIDSQLISRIITENENIS